MCQKEKKRIDLVIDIINEIKKKCLLINTIQPFFDIFGKNKNEHPRFKLIKNKKDEKRDDRREKRRCFSDLQIF